MIMKYIAYRNIAPSKYLITINYLLHSCLPHYGYAIVNYFIDVCTLQKAIF